MWSFEKIVNSPLKRPPFYIQGDQLNKAVLFWYLVKSDLFIVHVYSSLSLDKHFFQRTRKTRPCLTGHPVDEIYDVKKTVKSDFFYGGRNAFLEHELDRGIFCYFQQKSCQRSLDQSRFGLLLVYFGPTKCDKQGDQLDMAVFF